MKSVLISIRPKWVDIIASGKKTVEVRKTRPKLETPFKCYIYQTLPKWGDWNERDGHVIGEFMCDRIFDIHLTDEGYDFDVPKMTGLTYEELEDYLNRKNGYGWHISNLKIYEKPKKISEFRKALDCHRENDREDCIGCWDCDIKRPPQSWCYVWE